MIRPEIPAPWAMLAELTHACPLRCPYCSNPLELIARSRELATEEWARVMAEAAELGVVHAHLSGGEPLLRRDLTAIVAAADGAGIYTQLVTSGAGLHRARLAELAAAGLRSVQLSVQDATAETSDRLAGTRSFAAKERAAGLVRESGLPLGVNVVLHRHNLDSIHEIIAVAVSWGAERVELANTQFYGWALRNRGALLPTRDQLSRAEEKVKAWRERLEDRVRLVWVVPDYFEGIPKPCMGGWGAVSLTVAPDGAVLPCPGAYVLPGLTFPSVREDGLRWIWERSPAFNAYRGTAWMDEPCAGCPRRETDFGGCRCQAYALTGHAGRTDPACSLSPDHHLVQRLTAAAPAGDEPLVYRRPVSRSGRASGGGRSGP
ncbi:pyrroloquinoline quinone biosynthesis protein PqqE [Sphaerisporangium fuscum]|uniref:pyrroloquinoline quinone biosynthesis protein PqqE n=1 Tax=Sphaerisporangium fuscum TaxID=2835868 RepID=UPI001BDD2002|nr:pyrroloquinoline quinone biosynthesis protein PqqE [Sphaerisporangium fuscum]